VRGRHRRRRRAQTPASRSGGVEVRNVEISARARSDNRERHCTHMRNIRVGGGGRICKEFQEFSSPARSYFAFVSAPYVRSFTWGMLPALR
jgi:hypothetical protein